MLHSVFLSKNLHNSKIICFFAAMPLFSDNQQSDYRNNGFIYNLIYLLMKHQVEEQNLLCSLLALLWMVGRDIGADCCVLMFLMMMVLIRFLEWDK